MISRLLSMRAFVALGAAMLALTMAACSSALFSSGPRPSALAGEWIDLRKTTSTDSSLWILAPNGDDESRRVSVGSDGNRHVSTRHYGFWYLSGSLVDSSRRICFKKSPRFGGTCVPFELDSAQGRRRLTVHGYQGAHSTSDRVLIAVLR
ncbi:MAG: hypothetical protein JWM95_5544 [Gemmatimonadetes bacterium]|nr:hypothetical protein [Gemmatimonadota bacterium]